MRKLRWPGLGLVPILVLSFSSRIVHAQTESISSITSAANNGSDQSMIALQQVFGSVITNPLGGGGGGSGSTIASVLGMLNASVLVIGALWACYLFVAAMIATGAEGEFLGQKRSSIWFTIRNGVGFTLLVPFTGGYSGAQLIMLWATMMGIGIANLGMSAATTALANGGTLVSTPPPPEVISLSKALFESGLCAQAANAAATSVSAETGGVSTGASEQFSVKSNAGQVVLMNGNGLSCGGASVSLNTASSSITPSASTTGLSSIVPDTSQITSAIATKQQAALTAMQTTLYSAAGTYVSSVAAGNQPADPQATINSAASTYQSTIQSAISSASSSINSISSTIQSSLGKSGWIMLGAWYQAFAMANSQLTSAVATTATAIAPTNLSNLPYPDLYNKVMASYELQLQQDASTTVVGSSPNTKTLASNSSDPANVVAVIFRGQDLVSEITSAISSTGTGGTVNPIIGMKNVGDDILIAGWSALSFYAASAALGGAASDGIGWLTKRLADIETMGVASSVMGAFQATLSALAPLIMGAIMSLFCFGAMLSVYIPMLPFIIWFGGVIGWFVVVCEGVVAAPLWAFSHLDGDGEGMGQKTTYGYVFLVNLMLRPVMMVIGFLLASAGIVAFGQLLNTMFAQAMANAQFSSFTGIVSIVAFIILYVGMCQTLCQTFFGLVTHIPNVLGSWLGTTMANEFGKNMHEGSHAFMSAGMQKATPQITRGFKSSTGSLTNSIKQSINKSNK